MDPLLRLSAQFHQRWDQCGGDARGEPGYGISLLYLLLSQTSCFRYWATVSGPRPRRRSAASICDRDCGLSEGFDSSGSLRFTPSPTVEIQVV
jgi:hypothetical protein